MTDRPVTVVELPSFLRSAKEAGLEEPALSQLVDFLAQHPLSGALIKGCGGIRKARWAPGGLGKRGAFRVIYYFYDEDAPVYAILVYGKNRQDDMTPDQRRTVAGLAEILKAAIRSKRER
jgi:mRNA-degrading endonuclease RelE of RelBE toxin-antitoxin system